MSSLGTGYDLSATTFSPQGRLFQVEYAEKAAENSGTAIGLRCKDGVVLAVEKIVTSKLLESHSNRRIHTVDRHVGMVESGLMADCRQLANHAMKEARQYKDNYDDIIPVRILNERLSAFVQMYTLYAHVRPFGSSVILGGYDGTGPQLYKIEPSGVSWGYYGCSAGKAQRPAKSEIEKLDLKNLTCRQAALEAARIIYTVNDEEKDKLFKLELSWVCEESNMQHQFVPEDLYAEAIAVGEEAQLSSSTESTSDEDD
eukprot:TRINITY_DN11218_c0_g1_i1.p1 TRINITY_DN11218_c0_g1~~TRINITY_DN11218_c0_g1_i1.p1  ORF type:complete len:268 (+),score=68.41 TRINITY_DN11218_c0_g1_i1:36-806(+)